MQKISRRYWANPEKRRYRRKGGQMDWLFSQYPPAETGVLQKVGYDIWNNNLVKK